MPVEIRELVIKAVVDTSARQPGGGEENRRPAGSGDTPEMPVEEIVSQVLRAIEEHKNER